MITLILIMFSLYLGRLSSVTTLKLNDNCLSSLPYSIGGYVCMLSNATNTLLHDAFSKQ